MTRADVIRMAREAGYEHPDAIGMCEDFAYFDLDRFAALVAAAEREACAQVCEEFGEDMLRSGRLQSRVVSQRIACGIRARGKS